MQRAYTENLHLKTSWFNETMCLMPQSCRKKINQWLKDNFITIVAMAAILILIQIFDLFIAGSLFRMFGEKGALKKNKRLVGEDGADSDSEPDPDGGEQNCAFMDPDEGAPEPNYMTAGDANNMADQYNQNQEPFHYNQNQNHVYMPAGSSNIIYDQYNQNQGFQDQNLNQNQGFQDQNLGFQEPLHFNQNQGYHGYQEASQHY